MLLRHAKSSRTTGNARVNGPSPPVPLVSIIIPSAADPKHLLACLRSLESHMPVDLTFEVIAVLNSNNDYHGVLTRSSIEVRAIGASTNLGLAGAGNRARADARGNYLVLLHDDSQIEQGWIEALLDAAESHPEAGAIGGKVLSPDGKLQGAGMILWRDGTTAPPWLGAVPAADRFAVTREVDYIGTSSLMIRANTWDAVGGLDEQFYPLYYVDVDLAMKIRRHGQIVLYEPRSRTRHHQGASGDLRWRWFVTHRNRSKFLEKWGTALDGQVVRIEGSQESIDSAMRRAELFEARVRADKSGAPGPSSHASAGSFDRLEQERRCLLLGLGLYSDYADALEHELETAEQPSGELGGELSEVRRFLEHLQRAAAMG